MTTTRITLTVDGTDLSADPGKTLLDLCKESGIYIPTLCHADKLNPNGSCGICVVDLEDHGLVSACTTLVADGMVIRTKSRDVLSARKQRLEELLGGHYGDCVAPCTTACPAHIDVQGYIALISRGAYKEASELIRENLPLPATIGRVCPHPCEEACRRNLVDQPLSIRNLKRFAGDYEIAYGYKKLPEKQPPTNKRVAVVGSGPAGLTAAYYLSLIGHEVVVFEALPKAGGMLRYGIPDYRLPQDILDNEIDTILSLGVELQTEKALGKDFTIKSLKNDGFQAVFLGIGAHNSYKMRIEGEDLDGVWLGTDFLRMITLGTPPALKDKSVAIIGGGNTAIDASRSALRLEAKEVTILYRRSRVEMPAGTWEIEEAEEEGIKLNFLAAPVRIIGKKGSVSELECIKMVLGEPDASGRRRPVPVPGSEFTIPVDIVIAAVGQMPDLSCLSEDQDLELGRQNIKVDDETMMTNINGVFSGGDCVIGAATAIEAVAAGKTAALSIDNFLKTGVPLKPPMPFSIIKGDLEEIDTMEYTDIERVPRRGVPTLRPDERKHDFTEFEKPYAEDMALKETERCLECGCKASYDCKLRDLSTEHDISLIKNKDSYLYPVSTSHAFIERDPNKCIVCGLCVQTCNDIQGCGALHIDYRVGEFKSTCEACGQCMAVCPTGALASKKDLEPEHEVTTTCPYCGCGCSFKLGIRGNFIVKVTAAAGNPANEGQLCVKGQFGNDYINHPGRLTEPLIKQGGKFVKATWDEALALVAEKLAGYKGGQFAVISSAKCSNEENYLIQKFTRAVMKTNNVDHCARLCHAPTVAGLVQSFGSGAMTNSIAEIRDAKCIFAIGTNTTAAHPIIGLRVKEAVWNGAALIVANPKKIDLCRYARIFLQHKPGTDVVLMMGMMRVIVDEGLFDQDFIDGRCENFEEFKKSIDKFDLKSTEKITGVSRDKITAAARLYAETKPGSILYSMGITQHSHGTDNVLATSNLAMLTGNVGKRSAGVNPLRGQNNVQGACDMGALPNVYPGYQKVIIPEIREKFEKAWGCSLDHDLGLTHMEIFDAVFDGKIKALYLVGENPLLSEANSTHAREAIKKLDFFVAQDIFLTETAQLADVVLPGASYAEKDGTITNTERRVQRIREAIKPVGSSKPDWKITCEIAEKMGETGFGFENPEQIMEEIASVAPIYGGLSYKRLEGIGLQWPCPSADHPGTQYLHSERFATPNGKGKFFPLEYKPSAELPDSEYPLLLTTDRSLYHFHTSTMTRKVEGLNLMHGCELIRINPEDASRLGLKEGDMVHVTSRRGKIQVRTNVTDICPAGVVSMTFHFAESPVNELTNPVLDPVAKIPETKVCSVKIEKA
jgi:formate dehydrogenase major subunit